MTDIVTIKEVEDAGYTVKSTDLIPLVDENGENPVSVTPSQIVEAGVVLLTKTLDIGAWDMENDVLTTVEHEISDFTKIKTVIVMIITDGALQLVDFNKTNSLESSSHGIHITSTTINLIRGTNGFFDTVNYNNLSINRGSITIQYLP